MDLGAWWAAVHGVARSQTQLSDFTFTFHFHALEKEMATHSSVLAWRIPRMEEPGGLPSVGSHRVGHDWCAWAAAAAAAAAYTLKKINSFWEPYIRSLNLTGFELTLILFKFLYFPRLPWICYLISQTLYFLVHRRKSRVILTLQDVCDK